MPPRAGSFGRPLLALTLLLAAGGAEGFNHSEIPWQVTETPHFTVAYPPELEPMARRVTEVAEAVYPRLASTYGEPFRPGEKIRIVVTDTDDYSNGYTWAQARQVVIYATSLDTPLRGQHEWLWDVLPHELGHVFSLREASPFPENVPGVSFDAIGEHLSERTLFGGSILFPSEVAPGWYAEGAAQMDAAGFGSESWDARREMLLGMSWLGGTLLDFDRMGDAEGKGTIDAERIYNEGFSLLRFLEAKKGAGARAAVARAMGRGWRPTIGGALREVFGDRATALEAAWRADLDRREAPLRATWAAEISRARLLQDEGTLNLDPNAHPAGAGYAFRSNRGSDYGAHTLYWAQPGKDPEPLDGASGDFSWTPDGKALILSAARSFHRYGSTYTDLWRLDPEGGDLRRLTVDARASDPAVSPDGARIAFVHNARGTRDLWMVPATGGSAVALTDARDFSQISRPAWAPDGASLVFSKHQGKTARLWRIGSDGSGLRPLTEDRGEDRDPVWTRDGRWILFSSDRTGRFNLYALAPTSGELFRLTDVAGGAFHPSPTSEGSSIFYAGFTPTGFAVFEMAAAAALWTPEGREKVAPESRPAPLPPAAPPLASRPYRLLARPLQVVPGGVYESFGSDRFLLGALGQASDLMDRHTLTLLGYAGLNQEAYDVGGGYRNDQLPVSLFADALERVRVFPLPLSLTGGGTLTTEDRFTFDQVEGGAEFDFAKPMEADEGEHNLVTASGRLLRDVEQIRVGGQTIGTLTVAGREAQGVWKYQTLAPRDDAAVNPSDGRSILLSVAQRWTAAQPAQPLQEGSVTIPPSYATGRFEGSWTEYVGIVDRVTLSIGGSGGWIPQPVLPLDRFYLGGYYSFLSITGVAIENFPGYAPLRLQGERYLLGSAALTFPILHDVGLRLGPFYLDKVYADLFSDGGNAFLDEANARDPEGGQTSGACRNFPVDCDLLYDAGGDLKLMGSLFYRVPFNSFFKVAYGFQSRALARRQSPGTPVPSSDEPWRFYLGIGTGF